MTSRLVRSALVLIPLVSLQSVLIGCAHDDDSQSNEETQAVDSLNQKPDTHSDEEGISTVKLESVDRAAYDEVIASHQGKVVLVDFWATWCAPCVQQFPHTVELNKQLDADQFAVVSVSMDDPGQKESVLEFLREKKATFDNLISSYGVGIKGFDAFEIIDGSIPHYKIYDRSGKLRHVASDNAEVDALIEKLLAEE